MINKPTHEDLERRISQLENELEILKVSENKTVISIAKHNKILTNIGDVVVIIDKDGINRYKSPNIEKYFGWTPYDVVGKATWELIHPDDLINAKLFINNLILEENSSGTFECKYKCKDGNYKWIMFTGRNLLHDPDINGILGNYHDITDRKLAEKELIETKEKSEYSEARYRGLITNLETGVVVHANDTSIILCNSRSMDLLGLSEEQMKGKTAVDKCWKFVYEDNTPIPVNDYPVMRILNSKKAMRNQILGVCRKKNDVVWLLVNGFPITKDSTEISEIIISFIDVTEHRNSIQLNRKLQKAVESSKVCVIITDYDGNIEYANPYFTELTGYTQLDYLGKSPNLLKTELHPNNYYKNLWFTLKNGKTWEGEFCNRKKNGEVYWEKAIISPINDANNKITHFVAIKTDITSAKIMNDALIEAKVKAEESDLLKSVFLENISHEIRTPMNAILGFSKLLLKLNLKEEKRNILTDKLHEATYKLLSVVENVVTLSHIRTKQLNINKVDFQPTILLTKLQKDFNSKKHIIEKSHLDLILNMPVNECVIINNDYTKINQILTILLDNSFKFTEKGSIEFGYIIKNNQIDFFVKDTGIGIPVNKQKIVLESFTQADKNIRQLYGGMGIGLTIAQGLVSKLNGTLRIDSIESVGTTVSFCIPAITS
jgi:PAS domain S-box-containing protein